MCVYIYIIVLYNVYSQVYACLSCLSDVYVGGAHVSWLTWNSEDNFVESVFSFHVFVDFKDRTPVSRQLF